MKKSITLLFAAGILLWAGGCATPSSTRWEYKVVAIPRPDFHFGGGNQSGFNPNSTNTVALYQQPGQQQRDRDQDLLNQLGQDGWQLVSKDDRSFYLKRAVK